MKKFLPIVIIAAVVLVGVSFYGGMKYGQSKNSGQNNGAPRFAAGMGRTNGQGRVAFGGSVSGSILSKDDKSMTVQVAGGGSKIIFFSDKTTVAKSVDGVVTDLNVGENVVVMGQANSDGSVTASNVQIRPATPVGQVKQPAPGTPVVPIVVPVTK